MSKILSSVSVYELLFFDERALTFSYFEVYIRHTMEGQTVSKIAAVFMSKMCTNFIIIMILLD